LSPQERSSRRSLDSAAASTSSRARYRRDPGCSGQSAVQRRAGGLQL
jgi:hypothetical protein